MKLQQELHISFYCYMKIILFTNALGGVDNEDGVEFFNLFAV